MPIDDNKFIDDEEIIELILKARAKGFKDYELEFMTFDEIRQVVNIIQ